MSNRFFGFGLVLFVGGAGLAFTQSRAEVQPRNLDNYAPDRLMRDLINELDDIEEDAAPDGLFDIDVLQEQMMAALSDDGDDAAESDLDIADLEAEMAEDDPDVSLEDTVHEALVRADEISLQDGSSSGMLNASLSSVAQSRQNQVAQERAARDLTAQYISNRVYRTRR